MDRREHHRAQLRLPLRIRWNTPFGQKTEICKTLDISRGGLLAPCQESHAPGVPLWVTFPFDPAMADQPELLAKVVRATPSHNGNSNRSGNGASHEQAVALHFELPFRPEGNGNGHAKVPERRGSPRRPLALPLRVRPQHVPWFEQAMTIDVSADGLRFLSNREYQEGARLLIAFETTTLSPWASAAETSVRVTRIQTIPESTTLAIVIVREP
jgi:hypothetical protein